MRIYRWKKPQFSLSLSAGGSLAPSTEYWVFIWYQSKYAINAYYDAHSPVGEVKSITTDASNLTIEITWWCEGDITGFEDAGGGYVRVFSEKHCLTGGNTITIASGTYAGSHTVVWDDSGDYYDSFLILTTYVDTYVTTWSCSIRPNEADGIKVWMCDEDPRNADGSLKSSVGGLHPKQWASHAYYANGYSSNPIVKDTCVAISNTYEYLPWLMYCTAFNPADFLDLNDTGTPTIYDTGSSLVYADVLAEIVKSGITGPGWRNVFNTYLWDFHAHLILNYWEGSFDRMNITINYGNFYLSQITFTNSNISSTYSGFRTRLACKISNCNFYDWANLCDTRPVPIGSDNKIFLKGNWYLNSDQEYDGYDVSSANGGYQQFPYPNSEAVFKNGAVRNSYVYWVVDGLGVTDWRYFQNVYIDSPYSYDIRGYNYNNHGQWFNFENIDTPRTDNVKKVYVYGAIQSNFRFWRKGKITVKFEDQIQIGASVRLIDDHDNEYEYTTGINGEIEFDVIEQISELPGGSEGWTIDTFYKGWIIRVYKDGYQELIMKSDVIKDFVGMTVFLSETSEDLVPVGFTNDTETEVVRHLFLNEDIPYIGDTAGLLASSTDGNFYAALFTLSPGEEGSIANEAAYAGYARVPVPRGPTGWDEYMGKIRNLNQINFPECTGDPETLTYCAIMKEPTGDKMVCYGELDEPMDVDIEGQPQFGPYSLQFKLN